jgi:hypothetical protein
MKTPKQIHLPNTEQITEEVLIALSGVKVVDGLGSPYRCWRTRCGNLPIIQIFLTDFKEGTAYNYWSCESEYCTIAAHPNRIIP